MNNLMLIDLILIFLVGAIMGAVVLAVLCIINSIGRKKMQVLIEEAKKKKVGNGATLYYFKEMGEHAASNYLTNIEKPVLIMQGEKDFQATVEKDFNAYKELLSDKNNVTFRLYDNLNHAFVPSVYGNIMKANQEYNVEQHIGEEVITDIANWILKGAIAR